MPVAGAPKNVKTAAGVTQLIECQPSKLNVEGLNPFARFVNKPPATAGGLFTPRINGRRGFKHSRTAPWVLRTSRVRFATVDMRLFGPGRSAGEESCRLPREGHWCVDPPSGMYLTSKALRWSLSVVALPDCPHYRPPAGVSPHYWGVWEPSKRRLDARSLQNSLSDKDMLRFLAKYSRRLMPITAQGYQAVDAVINLEFACLREVFTLL